MRSETAIKYHRASSFPIRNSDVRQMLQFVIEQIPHRAIQELLNEFAVFYNQQTHVSPSYLGTQIR